MSVSLWGWRAAALLGTVDPQPHVHSHTSDPSLPSADDVNGKKKHLILGMGELAVRHNSTLGKYFSRIKTTVTDFSADTQNFLGKKFDARFRLRGPPFPALPRLLAPYNQLDPWQLCISLGG